MEQNISNNRREDENEISLTDIIHTVKTNWLWFVLSVAICGSLAAVYLLQAPKVYTRTASVLIKDDSKGGAISESAAFEDLGMFNVKRNVDNEVLIFQSELLMATVARRLHLDLSYTVRQGLRSVELYSHSPVSLQFFEAEEAQVFSLKAVPVSGTHVLLTDFSVNGSEKIIAALNDTVTTPLGKVLVTPTLYYADAFFQRRDTSLPAWVLITPSLYYTDDFYHVPVTVEKRNMANVIEGYKKELKVALAGTTSTVIKLTLNDVSIPRADDVLNTLITVYNEAAISDKNLITINTSNFISERLIIIEKELGNVDADIELYKRENRLTDIQSETGMYLRESSQHSQDELGLENQKTLARYIRDYLADPSHSSDLIPANIGISDINIEGLIAGYNTDLLKRDRLIGNSSNRNPVVMDLNNSLTAMKQTIIRTVDNLLVGLDIQIRNLQARDKQNIRRITEIPTQQRHVLSIERQQKIKEELYLYLLNKREENALTQAITESNARIVDPAGGSSEPVSPKTLIVVMAAFILGIVVPSGYLWMQNALNTAVRNRREVEDAVSIPFLGDIPLRGKKEGDNQVAVSKSGRDPVSEAFRIIRTNMDFMQVKTNSLQVVMFTSFHPGAGKTFVSINLATSIAQTHKKVLLVDLDLRRQTLSSLFRQTNNPAGITHYLSGQADDFQALINKQGIDGLENLGIIYAGPVPPNPAELLLSNRLDSLIDGLRKEYDYIFLDNVPAGLVADASIINRVADLTVYVLRAGQMDRRQLPELERLYKSGKFKNMAIVLNAVDYKKAGIGYYGYRYGYGS